MLYLIFIILALFLGFISSGSEMGLYCVNRLRLNSRAETGRAGAKSLLLLTQHPGEAINTILIANNITHYIATASCAALLIEVGMEHRADFYSTLILAPAMVVFTEIMPKSLFFRHSDVLMYRLATWLRLAGMIFKPLLLLLSGVHNIIARLAGARMTGFRYHFTPEKLRFFFSRGVEAGVVSNYQHKMMNNVLRVKNTTLDRTATIPLQNVVMVPEAASFVQVHTLLEKHNYSRIPVFRDVPENIIGIINLIDIVEAGSRKDVTNIMQEPVYVKKTDSVAHALYVLQRSSRQMAVVLDAGGKAEGICTVKDLVEEIVGEIYDW